MKRTTVARTSSATTLSRLISDYGILLGLLLLCAYYSYVTWDEQHPTGSAAGIQLAETISGSFGREATVLVLARDSKEDIAFADSLERRLADAGLNVLASVKGQPRDARNALDTLARPGVRLDAIACNDTTARWAVLDNLEGKWPSLGSPRIVTPASYWWPNFLKGENLLNIANQIVVIAIIAIGMTLVIITAGIDLSVGSLIALSAVVSTLLIRDAAGAKAATAIGMIGCCLAGVAVCAAVGGFSGTMVTVFRIPPFIVTLAMMLVASGLAYTLARGQSIYEVPASFTSLGRGVLGSLVLSRLVTTLAMVGVVYFIVHLMALALSLIVPALSGQCRWIALGGALLAGAMSFLLPPWPIPIAVLMMALLYAAAHIVMTRTKWGRYLYAVGGNAEAARLSGVPIARVVIFAYALSGALAGLGGIVMASQLNSGAPTYGQMYELYVIAAVVVGGTSLAGGEGKVLGTLVGAFIIAVIQNGMNLTNVESYTQKVVLGLVILGAVLLDMLKKRRWRLFRRR